MQEGRIKLPDGLLAIRREVHNIKGQGTTFDYPIVTTIAHRFEDFLEHVTKIDGAISQQMFVFIDWITRILTERMDLSADEMARIVRRLPSHGDAFDHHDLDVEALIVVPTGTGRRILRKILEEAGVRVVSVSDAAQGLTLAARMRPDLIVVSAVMDPINGLELVRAMREIAVTRAIPAAILTSYDRDDPHFHEFEMVAHVLHLDQELKASVGRFLAPVVERAHAAKGRV
jgi:CheY-like chemotaxis protein